MLTISSQKKDYVRDRRSILALCRIENRTRKRYVRRREIGRLATWDSLSLKHEQAFVNARAYFLILHWAVSRRKNLSWLFVSVLRAKYCLQGEVKVEFAQKEFSGSQMRRNVDSSRVSRDRLHLLMKGFYYHSS